MKGNQINNQAYRKSLDQNLLRCLQKHTPQTIVKPLPFRKSIGYLALSKRQSPNFRCIQQNKQKNSIGLKVKDGLQRNNCQKAQNFLREVKQQRMRSKDRKISLAELQTLKAIIKKAQKLQRGKSGSQFQHRLPRVKRNLNSRQQSQKRSYLKAVRIKTQPRELAYSTLNSKDIRVKYYRQQIKGLKLSRSQLKSGDNMGIYRNKYQMEDALQGWNKYQIEDVLQGWTNQDKEGF